MTAVMAALVALLGLAGAEEPSTEVRPIALQDAECRLPESLATLTGHALLRYRVAPSGKVDRVEPLFVTVGSESRRAAFIEALQECVKSWRYRPKTSGGIPEPISLLVALHYFEPAPPDATMVPVPGGAPIPMAYIVQMREAKLKLAAGLLAGEHRTDLSGDGWVLRTDLPAQDTRQVVQTIESTIQTFDAAFGFVGPVVDGGTAGSGPGASPATILLFAHDDAFNQVASFDNLARSPWPIAGKYMPGERMIYASRGSQPIEAVARTLAHEYAHHLVHQKLLGETESGAFWVNEGIASFIECLSPPRDGHVDLAAIDRALQGEGALARRPHAVRYLDLLADEARAGRLGAEARYLDEEPRNEQQAGVAYAYSWLVVHHLMNAHDGAYRAKFQSWVRSSSTKDQNASGLGAALGRPFDEIARELPEYLESLRIRR